MSRPSSVANRAWLTQAGPVVKVWAPRPGQADLAGWWWPLHRFVRAVDRTSIRVDLHLDDFLLVGAVPRSGRPDLWTYVHVRSGGELYLDDRGRSHRFQALRHEWWRGRFTACNLRQAVHDTRAARFPAPEVDRSSLLLLALDDDLPDTPERVPWGPALETPDGRTLAPLETATPSAGPHGDQPPARWPRDHPSAAGRLPIVDPHRGRPCDGPCCPFCGPIPRPATRGPGRTTAPPFLLPSEHPPSRATAPFRPDHPHWN